MVEAAVRKGEIELHNGGADARDFMYVEDAAAVIARACLNEVGATLNGATGESVRMAEAAEAIARCVQPRPLIVRRDPQRPAHAQRFSIERLEHELGPFSFTPFQDGVARCVDHVRQGSATPRPAPHPLPCGPA